jgi:hypothetical protein
MTELPLTPMCVEEMQKYLQEFCGIPVVLRLEGKTVVKCPYCGGRHHHRLWEAGNIEALCEDWDISITVNGRDFIPNYGYTIYKYKLVKEDDSVHFEFTGSQIPFPNLLKCVYTLLVIHASKVYIG